MHLNEPGVAVIYTDGSCHTQLRIGAWVAIIFLRDEKTILSGVEPNTTHNRMELLAVINALEFIERSASGVMRIRVVSDSQYVVGLPNRRKKLLKNQLKTVDGNPLPNADLVSRFYNLGRQAFTEYIKVKAHQNDDAGVNYNTEADFLSRKMVRIAGASL